VSQKWGPRPGILWRDPTLPPVPAWIDYDDAPPELINRASYEHTMLACERIWEETSNNLIVGVAMNWASIHHQPMPRWLCSAFPEVLVRSAPNGGQILDHLSPDMREYAEALLKIIKR
jgi:hypothetical protein